MTRTCQCRKEKELGWGGGGRESDCMGELVAVE